MPLLASNSRKRELSKRIVYEHDSAISKRRVTGQDHIQIQNFPELANLVGLRRLCLFPCERGIVEREIVPVELAGVVEHGRHVLHGRDWQEANLLPCGRVEELELGAGVGGDEPAVRRAPDVAVRGRSARQVRQRVGPAGGEAVDLGAGRGDVKEAWRLRAGVGAAAAEVAGGGPPRGADAGGAKEVRELEIAQDRGQDIGRQLGPVGGRRWRLHGGGDWWNRGPIELEGGGFIGASGSGEYNVTLTASLTQERIPETGR